MTSQQTQVSDHQSAVSATEAAVVPSESFFNSTEYKIDMQLVALNSSINELRWGWLDPKNRNYMKANLREFIEAREKLNDLLAAMGEGQHLEAAE
jgi:hypothetical protein